MRETVLARASKLDAEGAGLVEAIESTDPVAAERTTDTAPPTTRTSPTPTRAPAARKERRP